MIGTTEGRRHLSRASSSNERAGGGMWKMIASRSGIVLIVVLLAVTLMTAFIVEFAYGIYVSTTAIHNWATSQKASLLAKSGISLAVAYTKRNINRYNYSYPGRANLPFPEPFSGEEGDINLLIEDETGKLNINALIYSNGLTDERIYGQVRRLCTELDIPTSMVDIIADWIDPDEEPRVRDSEESAKNSALWTLSEIYLIPGIEQEWVDAVLPYITLYGDGRINLNAADEPVLVSLFEDAGAALERSGKIMKQRLESPLKSDSINKLFSDLGLAKPPWAVVKGTHFRLISTGQVGDVKRVVDAVIKVDKQYRIEYWREY